MNIFLYEDTTTLREGAIAALSNDKVNVFSAYDEINLATAMDEIRGLYKNGQKLNLAVFDLWVNVGDGFAVFNKMREEIPELTKVPLAIWSDAQSPESLEGFDSIADHFSIDIVAKSADDEATAISALVEFVEGFE